MNNKKINYIIFDLGGVLVNIHPDLAMQKLTKATPLPEEKVSSFFLSEAHIQLMCGKISFREFFDYFKEAYSFSKSFQDFLEIWEYIIGEPKQGIELLIQSLAKSHTIILCSNTDPEHWRICRERCRFIDPYFTKCFLSFEMGLVKPGLKIYQFLLDDLSTNANNAVFIDDSLENIEAAAKVGLHTIHVFCQRDA